MDERTSDNTTAAVIRTCGVGKSFSGVPVLIDVDFDIRPGEVHTLIGENGAGKSTLMKIIAGVHRPDCGKLIVDGQEVTISSPMAARRLGIALIHQEPLNFPDLSVAENVFLDHRVPRGRLGQIDWRGMYARTQAQLEALGVDLDPRTPLLGLSIADQQMVELAAALSRNARVLLMDEPTASLTPREVDRLFGIVRQLKASGVAIVFISHRLPEVFDVSDRITVLRDGRCIGTKLASQTTTDEIVHMMVGRPLQALYERTHATVGQPLLQVENLTRAGDFHSVSLCVRCGEIVGLAGLVGAGRTQLAEAIFGLRKIDSGLVRINGRPLPVGSPRQAMQHGLAYVPEDRQHNGLLLPMSVSANTSLADLGQVSRLGWISRRRERRLAETWRRRLAIRLREVDQPVRELSGGNQQKVVLSKWLATGPKVLIVDEPTRGIDVGAKAEVHHVLAELARQGHAILMISSDLPEVLAMSDRVLVMREGRIAAELTRSQATQHAVMAAATGTDGRTEQQGTEAQRHEGRDAKDPPSLVVPLCLRAFVPVTACSFLLRFREIGILVFVVAAFAIAGLIEPQFFTPGT
ncbi:MAG TPA: sugar ABC transporter ATP-binding protein, partial [Tepidisphaeraceae bacterium]|nr:sugar ABC transporter ATP-binding protein [Tepidisphaeraceae bacterium]